MASLIYFIDNAYWISKLSHIFGRMINNRKRIAGFIMVAVFTLTILFHILVITGIIPYTIVWGGRLQSIQDMYRFETVSILLNCFFLLIVSSKISLIKLCISPKIINGILWIMTVLFLVNTIGNLFSVNQWERIIFTPLTLLLSITSFLLVRKEKTKVYVAMTDT